MGVIVPSPLKLDPSTTQGLVWAMDSSGPRRTFAGDTASGQDIADLRGNTPALTRFGDCTWINSLYGKCPNFGGSSGYATGSISGLTGLSSATFRFGFYDDGSGNIFARLGNYSSSTGNRVGLQVNRGICYQSIENGGVASFPTFTWSGPTGYHIFHAVFNGQLSGLARLACYIDAVPQTLSAGGGNPGSILPSFITLVLGAFNSGSPSYAKGPMPLPVIFSQPFTQNQVAIDYANPNRILRQQRNWASILNRPFWNFADPAMSSYSDMGF